MKTIQNDTGESSNFAYGKNNCPECENLSAATLESASNLCFEFCDFENPDHLKALATLINHYMADPIGDCEPLNKLQQLRLVDGLAQHPTAEVLFAIIENSVVGLATCFVNFSTFQVKPYLYIHDIVVLQTYRGRGIGKAMMQKLIDIAQERKYCKITLEVRNDNIVAQDLYKSLGFDECQPNMLFWTLPLGKNI